MEPNPTAVPTPIDSWGLKILYHLILNKIPILIFGINSTLFLTPDTLSLLLKYYLIKCVKNCFFLPIPTTTYRVMEKNKGYTCCCWIGTCWYKVVRAVFTPILWGPAKTAVYSTWYHYISFKDGDVDIATLQLSNKNTLLNVFMVVSIKHIFPLTLLAVTLSPPPCELSKLQNYLLDNYLIMNQLPKLVDSTTITWLDISDS